MIARRLPSAVPTRRLHIRDRFSEVPSMTVEVLCVVLTLTIEVICRLHQNPGAHRSRTMIEWLGTMLPSPIVKQPSTGEHLDPVIANT